MYIIVSHFNGFTISFTERFFGKFAVNCLLRIPPLLAYVVTLPCENINVRKQGINSKLHCSVATCLRCGGVVSLVLSLSVKSVLKSMNIWQNYMQQRGCLVHFLRLLAVRDWACVYSVHVGRENIQGVL